MFSTPGAGVVSGTCTTVEQDTESHSEQSMRTESRSATLKTLSAPRILGPAFTAEAVKDVCLLMLRRTSTACSIHHHRGEGSMELRLSAMPTGAGLTPFLKAFCATVSSISWLPRFRKTDCGSWEVEEDGSL